MKQKIKIGLALMVAMAFILPSAAMADTMIKPYAGDAKVLGDPFGQKAVDITPEEMKSAKDTMQIAGVWQDGNLIPQVPGETDAFLYFGPCEEDGGPEIGITGGITVPAASSYKPWFYVDILTGGDPVVIEPELEIYKHDGGAEYVIYETSFEDNGRNYLEWEQIDGDCGIVGGYYDGWSWSDARASDGDHSFKCTMYDEYKNMQEDYLLMKCCKALDISDQIFVNVTFDTFVSGEYAQWYVDTWGSSIYTPLDYLEFGFRDCTSGLLWYISNHMKFCNSSGWLLPGSYVFMDTSLPLWNSDGVNTYGYANPMDYTPFVKKIDGQPGWWHVWCEMPVSVLEAAGFDTTAFSIWFKWTSDKERVFEGAYVDNIKIISIEPFKEKVYQGHSQNWIEADAGFWFEFPLCWDECDQIACGEEYMAIIKIKNDEGGYDVWKEVIFHVKDLIDCEIRNLELSDDFSGTIIPDGGVIEYTTDVHVTFTYHNNGNIPTTDVPVKATAYQIEEEILADYDMESGFSYYYFIGCDQVYLSSDFAWSGTRSMAFNDPETMHYGSIEGDCLGMLFGDPIDMEGVTEAYWDFYYMGKLGGGDTFYTMISAETGRYAYYWDVVIGPDTKVEPWVGPMQPQGFYQTVDLMPIWDVLVDLGETLDANGHMAYNLLIGWMLDSNGDSSFHYADEYDWSGAYVDDCTVRAKVRGDIAWTDSMVLPGPCAPCEMCTAQFVWEDVPYSCYEIEVETLCEGVTCQTVDNNALSAEFCVLENLEAMGKAEFVDYTECTPEAWCISNVVGNDCGNDGQGDMYALATNCDTHAVPAGVNDFVALGECGIDVSHLDFETTGGVAGCIFEETFDSWPNGWTTDNFRHGTYGECGAPPEAELYWGDSDDNDYLMSPTFDGSGATILEFTDFKDTFLGYDCYFYVEVWDGSMWQDVTPWTNPVTADQPATVHTVDISAHQNAAMNIQFRFGYDGYNLMYWDIDDICVEGSKGGISKAIKFQTGFEGFPFDGDFAVNTGWLQGSFMYGYPHSGSEWAYSWTYGDMLQTPVITLECDPMLSFWYAAEGSFNPMDLEVYVNGFLVFAHYGFTHTSYAQAIVPLTAFENQPVVIEFFGLTSDFYGQILDDIIVEDTTCAVPVEGDKIYVNMTYQVDLYDPAKVIIEYADVNLGDPGNATLIGIDSYGDGWDADYDYALDAFIDVFVNEALVLDDFTVAGSYEEAIIEVETGDIVKICYSGPDGIYASEHEWYFFAPDGTLLASDGLGGDVPENGCKLAGIDAYCAGCPDQECECPDGVMAWKTLGVITGNAPGVCQTFNGVIEPMPGTDKLCFRIRLDTTDPLFDGWDYAGPGIGFHLHEICISDIIYDPITGVIEDFCDDFEDGEIPTPTACEQCGEALNCDCADDHDLTWWVGCPVFGHTWQKVGPHQFCTVMEAEECGSYQIAGVDSYGDGWDADYDYSVDCFIDVYVNSALEVDDFTVTGGSDSASFMACVGDTIEVYYYVTYGINYYESEHEWQLIGPSGGILAQDGQLGGIPFHGSTFVTAPDAAGGFPAEPVKNAVIWATEIEDAYYATFFGDWNYSIPDQCKLSCELSADGGNNWFIISLVEGPDAYNGPIPGTPFDLTPWAGQSILIRVLLDNYGGVDGGFVCVDNFIIMGKQDRVPPTASISLSGNLVGPGQYAGPVTVTITATDDQGLGEIHYILDGAETVIGGDTATFTVSDDGEHTVEFWAVDATGNEGAHGTVTFNIDNTPPTVAITAPEPGLYLFGNKLLDMSKPFIIGAFTIEATADDSQGIAFVKFLLNGEEIGADVEAPYDAYCAVKNMGAATIKVIAEDGVGNTAEDSLDVTYYKFL